MHFSENRFVCASCRTEQCRGCSKVPYHKGYTCEQFREFDQSQKCRYCELPVCAGQDCRAK